MRKWVGWFSIVAVKCGAQTNIGTLVPTPSDPEPVISDCPKSWGEREKEDPALAAIILSFSKNVTLSSDGHLSLGNGTVGYVS